MYRSINVLFINSDKCVTLTYVIYQTFNKNVTQVRNVKLQYKHIKSNTSKQFDYTHIS